MASLLDEFEVVCEAKQTLAWIERNGATLGCNPEAEEKRWRIGFMREVDPFHFFCFTGYGSTPEAAIAAAEASAEKRITEWRLEQDSKAAKSSS